MSPEILEYLLRATVIWLALLAYYFLAGRKASFRFQRFFLLGGWLFGWLVPLLPSVAGKTSLPVAALPTISFTGPAAVVVTTVETATASGWSLVEVLPWLYLVGVGLFAARTLVQSQVTARYLRSGHRSFFNSWPVIRHQDIRSPFAARGYIFLPAAMTDTGLENTALLHESSHLRARHHYDKFFLTLGSILLWFHPLTWAYRRLLATVHEYEADAAVLREVPARTYGLQLLHCALGPTRGLGLFSSPLKQRIEMITNTTSGRKLRLLPLLGLCLLLLTLTIACSDVTEDLQLPRTEEIAGLELITGDPEETIVPDEFPKPAGMQDLDPTWETLVRGIFQEVRYPAAARQAGETGFVRLIVNISDAGAVTNVTMIGMDPADDEDDSNNLVVTGYSDTDKSAQSVTVAPFTKELDRMVNALAPFTPAQLDGKPTAVALTFDVTFKLEK